MSVDDPRSPERISEDEQLIEEKFKRDVLEYVQEVGKKWEASRTEGAKGLTVGFRGDWELRASDAGYEFVRTSAAVSPYEDDDYEYVEWAAKKLREEHGLPVVVGPRKVSGDADEVDSLLSSGKDAPSA